MRPNRGGGLRVMDAILPLFYEHKTLLLRLDARATDGGGSPPSGNLIRRRGPSSIVRRDHVITPDAAETRLRQTPIYYLTSHGTASAAEHMALALKRTHRATLIGETTRGAGHFGMLVPISAGFAAFVPFGRTYDPDTGKD